MANESVVTNERLALVAIQDVSAQPWEVRAVFAECLAHRVAGKNAIPRKAVPEAYVGEPKAET